MTHTMVMKKGADNPQIHSMQGSACLYVPHAKHMHGTPDQTDCFQVHSWDFSDPYFPNTCFNMFSSLQRIRVWSHNGKKERKRKKKNPPNLNSNSRIIFYCETCFGRVSRRITWKGGGKRNLLLSWIMRP